VASLFDCTDSTLAQDAVHQSMAALDRGEIIVVPTDTVYGLAVNPKIPGAIDRLVALKGRARTEPPPFLIGGYDQVWPLLAKDTDTQDVTVLIQRFWPGGLTLVLPVNPELDWDIGDTGGTIAVRMPNEPVLLELLRLYGALAVSSANLTGEPPCESAYTALNLFGEQVGVYLDAGRRGSGNGEQVPSTIVDVTDLVTGGSEIRVIRHGAVSVEELAEVLPEAVIA
jgi:tRNA threonylcarbamoyl adenosine modification protein (Sua5/YciO/YrdC/YwlC family)